MTDDRKAEGSHAGEGATSGTDGGERWREVVRLLEDNARARTRLEALETALLREARACDVPARLGYVSLEEFTERHLGYGRHAANERCRVSLELQSLPQLCAAYEDGTLMFSHVRELTRVATPQTEGAYLAAVAGKTTRQVQQLVSGKRAGDAPDAPPDPALVKHTVILELGGEAFAMWRRAQQVLEDEVGERLSTDELVMQLCTQAFAPVLHAAASDEGDPGVEPCSMQSRGTGAAMQTATEPGTDRARKTDTALRLNDEAESRTDDEADAGSNRSRGTTTAIRTDDEADAGSNRSRGTTTSLRTDDEADAGSNRSRGTTTAIRTDGEADAGSNRSRGTSPALRTDDEADAGSRQSRGTGAANRTSTMAHAVSAAPSDPHRHRTRSRSPRVAPPSTLHAVTTCRSCQRATASSVGSAEPLTPAQRDRALCDAIEVGDLESSDLTRPTLTVPAAIRRKVAIASNHACVVPGCRSRRHLTIHHLRYQAHGGGHTVENCVLACSLCRARHNEHYAAYRLMPRRRSSPVEERLLYAA